ncbi:MAG: glycoside hydrolase family 130 protein [Clostridiales bacterium]|nr:glycoside hydrolase family 130 protein [Clostridiales bacterium]
MGEYVSADIIRKNEGPVLTRKDVPYNAALVFNAGVTKYNGKYVMAFRNDYGDAEKHVLEGTNIGLAYSDDGIKWEVAPKPCFAMKTDEIERAYDPRLTVIDGKCYMCFAIDTKHGLCGGIASTEDFEHFDFLSMSVPDNRNMVLLPEKLNGNFVRLERPMPVYSRRHRDRFDIWLSESPDLTYWGKSRLVMGVEDVPFADDKIGPAAPPVKTEKGWLTTFHAVRRFPGRGKNGWQDSWDKEYYAGVALLDIEDPSKVIGIGKKPLIVSDRDFETEDGFRLDVVFPGGMILEESGEVKIYYGASDTVECLAVADVNDLIAFCLE